MKFIKLFIASSIIEFAQERASLSDFIRSLNDIYVERGIYFQLIICEDLSNAVAKDRKQAEYNQAIRESQYFYIIFGKGSDRADDAVYTIEEFDTALDQFRKSGAPKIYTYFRQLPEGESASRNIRDFMSRLDQEIGHYYSTFCSVDTIKLNMLLELTRDQTVGGTVKIRDGMASVDGHEMFSVQDIPLYSKNETVQKLLAQKAQLENEMSKLALEYAKDPAGGSMQRLLANSEMRNKITEQLHALEMDVLELFNQSQEKRQAGQVLDRRELDALRMIDEGNYAGAKILLEDPVWKEEIRRAEEVIGAKNAEIRKYISGQRTLISAYKAEDNTAETAQKILAVYEDIAALAEKHRVGPDVLYDYASFLYDQRRYPESLAVAQRLEHWYALEPHTSAVKQARLSNLMGLDHHAQNDFRAAEERCRKALGIFGILAEKNPDVYLPVLAASRSNLASLLYNIGSLKEAGKLYWEALKIYRGLAAKNPDIYQPNLAASCNNLATLLRGAGSFKEAEELYREALKICRELAAKNPDVYLPDLALSCNNLASFFSDTDTFKEAEELHREGLRIYRKLSAKNPDAYQPDLAKSCNNLAILLKDVGSHKEAEELSREALKIRRELAEKNPAAYLPDLADSCNDLASLLKDIGFFKKAEELHREALKIRRKLSEKYPDVYLPDLAASCNNLANLLSNTGFFEEAEKLYREALKIYRNLAEKNDAYLPDLASSCYNLASHLSDTGSFKEAEELHRQALKIRRELAAKYPNVYLPVLARSCNNLANLLYESKSFQEAEGLYREALKIYRDLAAKYPDVYLPDLARSCSNLAGLLKNIGSYREAEELCRETLKIYCNLAAKNPKVYLPKLQRVCGNLATLLEETGRQEEADKLKCEVATFLWTLAQ